MEFQLNEDQIKSGKKIKKYIFNNDQPKFIDSGQLKFIDSGQQSEDSEDEGTLIDSNLLDESMSMSYDKYDKYDKVNSSLYNLLLLGPAGTGKTSVITSIFNNSNLNVIFCAFTNKATDILRNMSKFNENFTFMTIHKLYKLVPRVINGELTFTFNVDTLKTLQDYDVIIFDECSIISEELFNYIKLTWEMLYFEHDKFLKHIFLGDYWQLPPVNEKSSIVFDKAIKEKWKVTKLSKVMRSKNELMSKVNDSLLSTITNLKKGKIKNFIKDFPYNILDKSLPIYINRQLTFYRKYLSLIKENKNTIIISYSLKNCTKINDGIQGLLDKDRLIDHNIDQQEIRKGRKLYFFKGDRCCIERPVPTYNVECVDGIYYIDVKKNMIYNGEIFEIIETKDIKIHTEINKYIEKKYFQAQLLTIKNISNDKEYTIVHIEKSLVNQYKLKLKNMKKKKIVELFDKQYPTLSYGYCLSVYKSQGSEWDNVLVNLSSIKYSIANERAIKKEKSKVIEKQLFKATYTACTRASNKLYLFWF